MTLWIHFTAPQSVTPYVETAAGLRLCSIIYGIADGELLYEQQCGEVRLTRPRGHYGPPSRPARHD